MRFVFKSNIKRYLYTFFILFIVGTITFSIYEKLTKKKSSTKALRLQCQKRATTFEKVYDKEQLSILQKEFKDGKFSLSHSFEKAKFMDSTLFKFINTKNLAEQFKQKFKSNKSKKLKIAYTIYENDIKDPKKKSDSCKLFRGYVVMKFLNQNNKIIYQIQIDFNDYKGEDIIQRLDCAIESFLTYK